MVVNTAALYRRQDHLWSETWLLTYMKLEQRHNTISFFDVLLVLRTATGVASGVVIDEDDNARGAQFPDLALPRFRRHLASPNEDSPRPTLSLPYIVTCKWNEGVSFCRGDSCEHTKLDSPSTQASEPKPTPSPRHPSRRRRRNRL